MVWILEYNESARRVVGIDKVLFLGISFNVSFTKWSLFQTNDGQRSRIRIVSYRPRSIRIIDRLQFDSGLIFAASLRFRPSRVWRKVMIENFVSCMEWSIAPTDLEIFP